MDDNATLTELISNIQAELAKLDEFESEVVRRPDTKGKADLLDSITHERLKLSKAAGSYATQLDIGREMR